MDYHRIAQQIICMEKTDLELRSSLAQSGQLSEGYHKAMERLHNEHAQTLEGIIDTIGYPTIGKVGPAASEAAWLVIQHAIGQPDLMRKCLKLLEQAVQEKQADPKNLAYLTDRIAVLEGSPQLYGTQFDWDESGELRPNRFDDLDRVNRRRASIGLNSLEEQTAVMARRARNENESPPSDLKKRNLEMDEWRKSVGWISA
ncbi:hypothetical protein GCM10007415_34200 [Parapedobacter pyrenivorans]|uniref:Uncharacterized protein n=1 Tax=Parapedobacter pyrenivorans TaxID=1305674 RepID=A0A917MDN8_9SPHI|nr:DUF6624 domain-containing protein [Parapedobacter pyrenivorans]GGG96149.1 hypothetical protein GCM10007415_34200 [Parapedobacter pyrenivorans]